jgi:indole-3-glycerol phosphate synthase
MAASSAARAAGIDRQPRARELDAPLVPLILQGFDVIAEIKDASPAEGILAVAGSDRKTRARDYARGGAAAISVLTEPTRFAGDIAHLREVVAAVAGLGIPVMRKDFLVEPLQILEARVAGASGVLLIATMLADDELRTMLDCAFQHSMFVLLEAFDEDDLRRCSDLLESSQYLSQAESRGLLIGVNTRNLRTLEVDPARLATLAPMLPANTACVAESGIVRTEDVVAAAVLGYELALVGTALMRSADPAGLISDMREAGRRRVAA